MIQQSRYIVFKVSDLTALAPSVLRDLGRLEKTVDQNRALHGKSPFKAVVVEADWPEYGPVWAALSRRAEESTTTTIEDPTNESNTVSADQAC